MPSIIIVCVCVCVWGGGGAGGGVTRLHNHTLYTGPRATGTDRELGGQHSLPDLRDWQSLPERSWGTGKGCLRAGRLAKPA